MRRSWSIVKGGRDDDDGNRTYFLPNSSQYSFTVVEKDIGEAWFCTEKDSINASFKKAKTCSWGN